MRNKEESGAEMLHIWLWGRDRRLSDAATSSALIDKHQRQSLTEMGLVDLHPQIMNNVSKYGPEITHNRPPNKAE